MVQWRSAGPALEGSAKCADFRITQKKGNLRLRVFGIFQVLDGKPSTDTLMLDVEGFDPARDLLYANAATTLAFEPREMPAASV